MSKINGILTLLPIAALAALTASPSIFAETPVPAATSKATTSTFTSASEMNSEEFTAKLAETLDRTEKAIKLVRSQITESQSAPFLPELYLQLGDLISQKSNALYYLQMEKKKKTNSTQETDKEFSPIVQAQKEAIGIYKSILRDFPKFSKRPQTLLRLAAALKSIDEIPEFVNYSSQLIGRYPETEEAMRARLLLGQQAFDSHDYVRSLSLLKQVEKVKFPYERNLAKYRIGLIYIAQERFVDALRSFEEVIRDPDLKEIDNPYQLSKKNQSARTDLKREALIDSIRAYTHVHQKDANPTAYYSRLAPSEVHFQEVIEKLALRYINLKKYNLAIRLLRTMSERTADPQKVLNIYQQVLMLIPIRDRINVPVEEMRFLLDRYNLWTSFYQIPTQARKQSYLFMEKQIRDLATTSHELSKKEKDPKRKNQLLERSKTFYLLYLGFFDRVQQSVNMATNLADIYFSQRDYFHSGDYYLRIFSGEFGRAPKSKARLLIENAILCLQKGGNHSYYENLRLRGLLIKAVAMYQSYDPSKRNDPRLLFAALKAEYEQEVTPQILEKLHGFASRFRTSSKAVDASELVLDYFNTRNDFAGLETWSDKILNLKLPNAAFNKRVAGIRSAARTKTVQEKVKAVAGYDDFAQGKSYLAAALSAGNSEVANEALKQALVRSKAEKDIQTFLQVATVMADKEKNPGKKAGIQRSIAQEYVRVTRFYAALGVYEQIMKSRGVSARDRQSAAEDGISTALMIRDWALLEKLLRSTSPKSLSAPLKARLQEQITDLLDSGLYPGNLAATLFSLGLTSESLTALFKAQYQLSPSLKAQTQREVARRCKSGGDLLPCRWQAVDRVNVRHGRFKAAMAKARPNIEGIEVAARDFQALSGEWQKLEGSGDALFELNLALKNHESYQAFGSYLTRVAKTNADLKAALQDKIRETADSGKLYLDRCRTITQKSPSAAFAASFCKSGRAPAMSQLFSSARRTVKAGAGSDPKSDAIEDFRRTLFAQKDGPVPLLGLAKLYYEQGHLNHAAAAAAQGASLHRDSESDFKAVLGCSVRKLGLVNEANFHLKGASSFDGLKESCQRGDES